MLQLHAQQSGHILSSAQSVTRPRSRHLKPRSTAVGSLAGKQHKNVLEHLQASQHHDTESNMPAGTEAPSQSQVTHFVALHCSSGRPAVFYLAGGWCVACAALRFSTNTNENDCVARCSQRCLDSPRTVATKSMS